MAVTESDVLNLLKQAHMNTASHRDVPLDATVYGAGALALEKAVRERDEALEALRSAKETGREAAERRTWATLVPESILYPEDFRLQGTKTGAGMRGRLKDSQIFTRNFEGLLLPIPGEVWNQVSTGTDFLVVATVEHQHHAVVDVVPYDGDMPSQA